jgi:hypothetical protein
LSPAVRALVENGHRSDLYERLIVIPTMKYFACSRVQAAGRSIARPCKRSSAFWSQDQGHRCASSLVYPPPMQFFIFQRTTMTFVRLTRGR